MNKHTYSAVTVYFFLCLNYKQPNKDNSNELLVKTLKRKTDFSIYIESYRKQFSSEATIFEITIIFELSALIPVWFSKFVL